MRCTDECAGLPTLARDAKISIEAIAVAYEMANDIPDKEKATSDFHDEVLMAYACSGELCDMHRILGGRLFGELYDGRFPRRD